MVGFLSGLLGIGGGLVIVPSLFYLLPTAGVNAEQLPHVAIATSLAAIILTSFSSAMAHQKKHNILWPVFVKLLPGIMLGALVSGFIADNIPALNLQKLFGIFVIVIALQMILSLKAISSRHLPCVFVLFICSFLMAFIASLIGIGGGVLLVPFLSFFGVSMRYAVGVSSIMGLCIAICGSIGYIVAGWNVPHLPLGTMGYIYVPAMLGIICTSMLMAPLGVKAASVWPTPVLKKLFSVLLLTIGLKIILN